MPLKFPQAVPEVPVSNVEKVAEFYVKSLGFSIDWGDDEGGIGCISQGECRIFLTNELFRQQYPQGGAIRIWLNMDSRQEVDALFERWRSNGADILEEPADNPYRLREFRVADLDGNQIRAFYDFSGDPETPAMVF